MKSTEYGLVLVLLLLGFGVLFYYETHSFLMISIASAIGSAYCVFLSVQQLMLPQLNVIRFFICQNIIWYCFPLSYFDLVDEGGLLDISRDDMVNSLMLIIIVLSIGWAASLLADFKIGLMRKDEPPLKTLDFQAIILPLCALQILMIATGHWSYAANHAEFGVTGNEETHNPITLLLRSVSAGIAPLNALHFGLLPKERRTLIQKAIFIGVMGLQAIFWFIDSRRNLMVISALSILVFVRAFTGGKISPRQILRFGCLGLFLGLGLMQAGKAFFAIRMAYNVIGPEQAQNVSFLTLIDIANNLPTEQIDAELDRNKAARPYIITSIGTFLRTSSGLLYGEGMINEAMAMVPSFLFSNKIAYMEEHPAHEELWNKQLGVPLNDYANSFILDGYADFGYFGFAIYTIIAYLLFRIALAFYSLPGSRALVLFCAYNFLFQFFHVENELGGFIVKVRDILLYLMILSPYFLSRRFSGLVGNRQEPLWADRHRPSQPLS